jgi:Na+-driven multidrug efflux pump
MAAMWFYAFPSGLAYFYTPSVYPYASPSFRFYVKVLALSPYVFYLIHFVLSMTLPSRRAFKWLMIILIIVVTLNLIGCEREGFSV